MHKVKCKLHLNQLLLYLMGYTEGSVPFSKQTEDERQWDEKHSTEDVVSIYHVVFL